MFFKCSVITGKINFFVIINSIAEISLLYCVTCRHISLSNDSYWLCDQSYNTPVTMFGVNYAKIYVS